MNSRARITLGVVALTLAPLQEVATAEGPQAVNLDYDAVHEYAYKYYLAYREKYGFALRVQQMLRACDLEQLAAQIDSDVPSVAIFAIEQFAADIRSTAPEASTREMSTAVMRATQNLTEAYELGYLEAFRTAAKTNSACVGVSKVYDTFIQGKGK